MDVGLEPCAGHHARQLHAARKLVSERRPIGGDEWRSLRAGRHLPGRAAEHLAGGARQHRLRGRVHVGVAEISVHRDEAVANGAHDALGARAGLLLRLEEPGAHERLRAELTHRLEIRARPFVERLRVAEAEVEGGEHPIPVDHRHHGERRVAERDHLAGGGGEAGRQLGRRRHQHRTPCEDGPGERAVGAERRPLITPHDFVRVARGAYDLESRRRPILVVHRGERAGVGSQGAQPFHEDDVRHAFRRRRPAQTGREGEEAPRTDRSEIHRVHRADPLHQRALLVVHRHGTRVVPAEGSVLQLEAVLHVVGRPGREGRRPCTLRALAIVGMDSGNPVRRPVERAAGELGPEVDVERGSSGVGAPHHRGSGIDERAVARFARPRVVQRLHRRCVAGQQLLVGLLELLSERLRLFHLLLELRRLGAELIVQALQSRFDLEALGQIANDAGEDAATRGRELAEGDLHRQLAAVAGEDGQPQSGPGEVSPTAREVPGHSGRVAVAQALGHQLPERHADELRRRVAEQPRRSRVRGQHDALLVDGDDRVGRALGEHAIQAGVVERRRSGHGRALRVPSRAQRHPRIPAPSGRARSATTAARRPARRDRRPARSAGYRVACSRSSARRPGAIYRPGPA